MKAQSPSTGGYFPAMACKTGPSPAFELNGEHPADRVLRAQAISSDVYLRGEAPPTPRQIAAVLHALADHTHNVHMLGPEVRALGADRSELGDSWVQATGLGRYLHELGDWLDCEPPVQE